MSINNFEKFEKRRVLNTYFSLVLSISLVLFFLGCLSVLLINSKKISNHFKEQIAITMYLTESIKPFEIKQLENDPADCDYIVIEQQVFKKLANGEYIYELRILSKEDLLFDLKLFLGL